jgi:hypothetical protein
MDLTVAFEIIGVIFALAAIGFSVYIMGRYKRGAAVWIYIGITSFCMLFSMLLGVVDLLIPVDPVIQRLEQYIFLLAAAMAYALSGIKLYEIFVYKE